MVPNFNNKRVYGSGGSGSGRVGSNPLHNPRSTWIWQGVVSAFDDYEIHVEIF